MFICYWCGKKVKQGDGAREHIIPATLLQDATGDFSEFIIPAENAHKACNHTIGNSYEHDFCQIIFNYSVFDNAAKKHVESKIKNLKQKPKYLKNQFDKMRRTGNATEIKLTNQEKGAFEATVKKIIKGLYFKKFKRHLDLGREYQLRIIWSTFNIEYDKHSQYQAQEFLKLLGGQNLTGNEVFKFRFEQAVDGLSSIWEFVFYNRFPIYIFLVHNSERSFFNWTT